TVSANALLLTMRPVETTGPLGGFVLIFSGVRRCCGIETFWGAILRSGGNYLLATILLCTMAAYAQAAVVLQYHHVSESTPASTSITPALFKQHMDYLAEQEFKRSEEHTSELQ